MSIGGVQLANNLVAAPMAGVTDRPFRMLCRSLGAGMAVSEMLTADKRLWETRKSKLRMDHSGEPGPIVVQIAGGTPEMLAEAARINVDHGARIIDINMGCPAKKVCNRAAGSALLADEGLVGRILDAVVGAVDIPVTLKIRTGPCPDTRNAVAVARLAERAGIALLTIHGRTRKDAFRGHAEYETIAAVKAAIDIPVVANGDIDSGPKAAVVLKETGADGLMIGRAAQGNPWIFGEIAHYLATGHAKAPPSPERVSAQLLAHLVELHDFYGPDQGMRVGRKHIGWYLAGRRDGEALRRVLVRIDDPDAQLAAVEALLPTAAVA
ncbi:MAG: tRNA dihydrouridine synthase DusB [Pseudomonadota bacterium]